MYRAFELRIEKDILKNDLFKRCVSYGKNKIRDDKTAIEEFLREVCFEGTIDGTALTEKYFPVLHKDVFLSYSHNDQDLAYMVAGFLNACFGLTVFIDSLFWGSGDALLREIDDEYCWQESSKTYNYHKRNFSTAHVHGMLTSALMKAMDQAEIIIFLNTPQSAPSVGETIEKDGYDEYTLSPWIYEEILLTTMLKETDWEIYRRGGRSDGMILEHFDKQLRIRYKLPKEKLIPLTLDDIDEWYREYDKRRKSGQDRYGGIFLKPSEQELHPLNVLYELKLGVEK